MKLIIQSIDCSICESNTATTKLIDFWLGTSYMPSAFCCDNCSEKILEGKRTIGVENLLYLGEISSKELKEFLEKWSIINNKPIDWINIPVIGKKESK